MRAALLGLLVLVACDTKPADTQAQAKNPATPAQSAVVDSIVEVAASTPAEGDTATGILSAVAIEFAGDVELNKAPKPLITITGGAHEVKEATLKGSTLTITVDPAFNPHQRYSVKVERDIVKRKGGKLTLAKAYEMTFTTSRQAAAPSGEVVREVFVDPSHPQACDAACAAAGATCQTACYYDSSAGSACYYIEDDQCWYSETTATCATLPKDKITADGDDYPMLWEKCCCQGRESDRVAGSATQSCTDTCRAVAKECVDSTGWAEGQGGGVVDYKLADGGTRAAVLTCADQAAPAAAGETLTAVTCGCR